MAAVPRLDVLIYAHDGRGLGHASRSIGVGLALRRLYPELKVLFVSGCNFSQELIGAAPLDWLKLPSYETKVIQGKSVGIHGKSMFSDEQLGRLRAQALVDIVKLYNPRLVLVDHTPQGKHKELVPALSAGRNARWILGIRGVVGAVKQARSAIAGQLFKDHYHAVLWYGDSSVLGTSHCEDLLEQYNSMPVECGYVLRLSEFAYWNSRLTESDEHPAGTVSIPWLGEKTIDFLKVLSAVLKKISDNFGPWRLFVDMEGFESRGRQVRQLFENIPGCRIESPGSKYFPSLLHSKTAIIYGGYNSLMDVIHAGIPALVILREMEDEEQQLHLQKLKEVTGELLLTLSEDQVSAEELESSLLKHLQRNSLAAVPLKKNGAACAAEFLHGLL